jgi:hypothetical protein
MVNQELRRYIVQCSERSDGPQCNNDHTFLVESPILPTQDLLKENYLISPGHCTNVSYPGCEDCGGSVIVDFKVEDYTPERASELELDDKIHTLSTNNSSSYR